MVGYNRPMEPPLDLSARLRDAVAREFQGARDPLVDRLEAAGPSLWRFRFRWREEDGGSHAAALAARVDDDGRPGKHEARALEIAQRAGIRAPTVWLTDPFLVVDWIEGESFAGAWRRRDPRAAPEALGQALADLHDATERPAERDPVVGRLAAMADRARAIGRDDLVDAATALRPARPRAATMALCHGDFRPEHVLLSAGGPTLVGWSRAGIGDPRLDLAQASLDLGEEFGGALRTPFLRVYRQTRSVAPEELEWFERLAALERQLGTVEPAT
jgi:aminoglycoside phosphotransferase (APT) family kinase protein